jgi:hypothetical protein
LGPDYLQINPVRFGPSPTVQSNQSKQIEGVNILVLRNRRDLEDKLSSSLVGPVHGDDTLSWSLLLSPLLVVEDVDIVIVIGSPKSRVGALDKAFLTGELGEGMTISLGGGSKNSGLWRGPSLFCSNW